MTRHELLMSVVLASAGTSYASIITETTPLFTNYDVSNPTGTGFGYPLFDDYTVDTTSPAALTGNVSGISTVGIYATYDINLTTGSGTITTESGDGLYEFVVTAGPGSFSVVSSTEPGFTGFEVIAYNAAITAVDSPAGTPVPLSEFPPTLGYMGIGFLSDPSLDPTELAANQWYFELGKTLHYEVPPIRIGPEPSTINLLGLGVVGLVVWSRLRNRSV